ncbi:MFS transporter, partial [Nonomuraea aridisoli]|uniref:MFS transporter n=1 Tax=Nonomuraea aridisoli TaxID=2070368 RepID=UPI001F167B56
MSQFGSQITYVALPLLAVTVLGAGAGEVGLLAALGTLTVLVVGLPAGVWVDRVRRLPVMIAMDVARAAVLLSVPLAWWGGWLSMGQLYVVAVLVGAGSLLFDVASLSLVPGLVGRTRLTSANSLLVSTGAGMDIAGRGIAGLLVHAAGAPLAILLDALTYMWSAACLRRITEPAVEPHTPDRSNPPPNATIPRGAARAPRGVRGVGGTTTPLDREPGRGPQEEETAGIAPALRHDVETDGAVPEQHAGGAAPALRCDVRGDSVVREDEAGA